MKKLTVLSVLLFLSLSSQAVDLGWQVCPADCSLLRPLPTLPPGTVDFRWRICPSNCALIDPRQNNSPNPGGSIEFPERYPVSRILPVHTRLQLTESLQIPAEVEMLIIANKQIVTERPVPHSGCYVRLKNGVTGMLLAQEFELESVEDVAYSTVPFYEILFRTRNNPQVSQIQCFSVPTMTSQFTLKELASVLNSALIELKLPDARRGQ